MAYHQFESNAIFLEFRIGLNRSDAEVKLEREWLENSLKGKNPEFSKVLKEQTPIKIDTCKSIIKEIQRQLLILGPLMKKNKKETSSMLVGEWFSHAGFMRGSRPKNLGEEIARVTQIKIVLLGLPLVSCSMPLAGDSISFTQSTKFN